MRRWSPPLFPECPRGHLPHPSIHAAARTLYHECTTTTAILERDVGWERARYDVAACLHRDCERDCECRQKQVGSAAARRARHRGGLQGVADTREAEVAPTCRAGASVSLRTCVFVPRVRRACGVGVARAGVVVHLPGSGFERSLASLASRLAVPLPPPPPPPSRLVASSTVSRASCTVRPAVNHLRRVRHEEEEEGGRETRRMEEGGVHDSCASSARGPICWRSEVSRSFLFWTASVAVGPSLRRRALAISMTQKYDQVGCTCMSVQSCRATMCVVIQAEVALAAVCAA